MPSAQKWFLIIVVALGVALPFAVIAKTMERDRSAEMERMFHFCRNQVLSNLTMMEMIGRAGKTLNPLCECIASNFVAALPDRVAENALQGDTTVAVEMERLYRRVGEACSRLHG